MMYEKMRKILSVLIKVEILLWVILSIIGLRAVFIVEGIITRQMLGSPVALMFMLLICFNVLIFTVLRGFNITNAFHGLISGICITGTLAIIPYLGHPESICYIPYLLYALKTLWIVSFLTITGEGIVKILVKQYFKR